MAPLRVLLVEDSANDAQLLLRHLEKGGYEVTHERVESAAEMEAALAKQPWDIVISDYNMPNFNAPHALSILKKSDLDLPFLVISGAIGEETAVETMKAGAHDYLMKGKLQRLIPTVERELREAKIRAQRAQAEVALYASEEKFRFMFEHNPVPMWIADGATLTFLEVNEAAVSSYGYSRRELLSMKQADLQKPGSEMKQLISSSHRVVGEGFHQHKDGRVIEVELHSDTLLLSGRKVVVCIAQDITKRKQTERELIEAREIALDASRLKSQFLANISHEIRTPLNGIIGLSEMLANAQLGKKEKDWVDLIRFSGDSLLAIVNQVLDFSKTESGKIEFEKIPFDFREFVRLTTDMFSYAAKNKKILLKIDYPDDIPSLVQGDPTRLRQVLVNLLDNAVKFTDRGHVTVRVKSPAQDDRHVTLHVAVEDSGIGLPESARARLFKPFSQADNSATRKYGGTGLGLAICQKLITLMGGEIGFDSEVQQGSTFWFKLHFDKTAAPSAWTNNTVPNSIKK